jgi:uncharacterized protein (TIGR00369 family)
MGVVDELIQNFIVGSPFGSLLQIRVEAIAPDRVSLRLPFRPEIVTIADMVHGGAIAALVDIAATAAVWSGADLQQPIRGATIGFTVNFLAAARGQDIVAAAEVIRRGSTISVCDVHVSGADGTSLARALVTYKLG